MQILLHPNAVAEAREAAQWYDDKQPGLGESFLAELDRSMDAIVSSPETWPRWPGSSGAPPTRRFLLSRFPFGIAYQVHSDRIAVIAIAHLRRKPGYWSKRESNLP